MSTQIKPCRHCGTMPEKTGDTIKCPKCGLMIECTNPKLQVEAIWNRTCGKGTRAKSEQKKEEENTRRFPCPLNPNYGNPRFYEAGSEFDTDDPEYYTEIIE